MENELNEIKDIKKRVESLSKKEAKKRLEQLYSDTEYHSNLYYNFDSPEITDFEYDMLTQEIRIIENTYPELRKKDESVNKVGGEASDLFSKVNLEVPMQSLMDVFSISEVENFYNKIVEEYGKIDFVVETKIDGLSVSLTYENGKLVLATTRGDGLVGENITENINMIESIPKIIPYKGKLIVRGEIYISKKDFEFLVKEQEENGEKVFANPRNAAAGSLRQKDSKKVKDRKLNLYVFNVQYCDKKFDSHYNSLEFVKQQNIDINYYIKKVNNFDEIKNAIEEIGNKRSSLTFEIDGAVLKVDDLNLREELGKTAKTPKWAVAFKYPPEQKETEILDIKINIGRTGILTPLAILKPVFVDGSLISKVSLHNFEYVEEKDIRIGDKILIQKAGDIIPEVAKVLKEKRTGEEKILEIPELCPVCNTAVIKDKTSVKCINLDCPSMIHRSIEHFASRDAMNIKGLADKNIKILLEKQMIKNISDIYFLSFEDFKSLKKNGTKFAENLVNAIEESKKQPLHKLINALGIPSIGLTSAKKLARRFGNLDNLRNATKEELLEVEDVGELVAEYIIDFFKNEANIYLIEKLKEANVNMEEPIEKIGTKLEEKVFVVTGSFEISRKEIEQIIEKNGGKISSSVSKKTDYLIEGEDAGSKKEKAQDLNIKIITYEEFIDMLK